MDNAIETISSRLQMLVLDRSDPQRNMARFYVLAVEPTLFGDATLVREWGRWGSRGRRRLDLYGDLDEASEALEDWLLRKTKRGYRIVLQAMRDPDGGR
jgi:predicted DNA-binding WGR domain protein